MKILLTGANGYIGMRLLPKLLDMGLEVVCAVRDEKRLSVDANTRSKIQIVEIDFLDDPKNQQVPKDIDAAYYLIHSMTSSITDFDEKEAQAAQNFNVIMENSQCKQVVYLSGIVNDKELSKHLSSRKNVEEILYRGP